MGACQFLDNNAKIYLKNHYHKTILDNMTGIIKSATGGRVIVDFNHPLSSKDLAYNVKVNKIRRLQSVRGGHVIRFLSFINVLFIF